MNEKNEIVKAPAGPGNFGECLVEGSAEDKERGRKTKRRAIAVSIALQSLGLTALVIAPMLAKPAEIKTTSVMPIPPYSAPRPVHTATTQANDNVRRPCVVCPTAPIAPIKPSMMKDHSTIGDGNEKPDIEGAIPGGTDSLIRAFDSRVGPKRPDETQHEKARIHEAHIDPALLTHRVEPVFPSLARQLRRNGRVELHAVIGIDGAIQQLQAVSGDPLFIQSALDAVRQWRYQPTKLSGQPVEVDTFITVIYTVNQQ